MRSRLRQLRLLFCALRYGVRLIWLAAPKHHKLHWFATLAARLIEDARLSASLHDALPQLAPLAAALAPSLLDDPERIAATLHDAVGALERFEEPLAPTELDSALHAALGRPPGALLASIDAVPLHNGWCEQTHVARLAQPVNGHGVVTLRLLRMKQVEAIDDDAALLCSVARWMERFSLTARRLQLHALALALREELRRRFDLRAQAANLSQSGHHFAQDRRVLSPDVIWDLCSGHTLAVQHVDTLPATDVAGLAMHGVNVAQVAAHLIEVVAHQAFEHGFFHAAFDARHVEVSIEPSTRGRLVLARCAQMSSLSSPEREFFVHGAAALFEQDYGRLAELHHMAGHLPATARPEKLEAELRMRSEAHFAAPADTRSAGALLHPLLHAVQPFGGQVSPRLAAAQRAFADAEALARTIHPEIDAWSIAHRALSGIAQRDLDHRGWIRRLSSELPHLAQIAPRVPQLLFWYLQQQGGAASERPASVAAGTLVDAVRREHRRTHSLLLACAACGVFIGVAAMLFAR
ncbi:ABC transporter [Burkholderia sp. WAC0059]|uniref:AarF/UbiB family protein n=1 Tax=Burkholderia sp. WAC0059 TaxID=2066022 RepID=UPI000C7F6DDE|nr:AarF/UbiB family protein [Burkholderia sp. WAC0059]PLZ02978.1 ABC transporter [Burkholderia sp. WAC0059]